MDVSAGEKCKVQSDKAAVTTAALFVKSNLRFLFNCARQN